MATPVPFAAILVAAGRSSRMGSDKLWADVWGRPTWRWSLDALLATPGLTRVAIAVGADAVMIDVHGDPTAALCDGPQALFGAELDELATACRELPPMVGRKV